jgi:hypothetical protein
LSNYNIEDVGVQERPLEDVIAELFSSSSAPGAEAADRDAAPNRPTATGGTSDVDVEDEQPVDR